MLSETAKSAIREQMARYPDSRSALGPALYIAQEECGGWIPREAIQDVADVLSMEAADVQSTMSFYVMYNHAPVGRYLLEVCHNISCALLGADRVIATLERECGIQPGEVSEDGLFTIKRVECLAACGGAPCLQVNGQWHFNVTPEQAANIVRQLRAEGGPDTSLYNAVYTPEKATKA